jgi:protein translocase SecG subunit
MKDQLLIAQIIVSVLLVVAILLQQRGTALGSAFGGAEEVYSTRRGIQK